MAGNGKQFTNAALAGQTILITGACSGMGKAAAFMAARAGAHVIVTGRKGHQDIAAEIRQEGGQVDSYWLEVTDGKNWRDVVDQVLKTRGRIHGFTNVAGINTPEDTLLNQTEEGWDYHQNVNLKGPWFGMKTIIPHMLQAGGGKVVNVSSVCGIIGIPNTMAYSAAKAGLSGLTRQVAMEYAAQGLRINSISPGVINTPIHLKTTQETLAAVKAVIPTKEMGVPEDIAAMVIYLLGPGSDFITGQDFPIDGGWVVSY